MKRMIKWLSIGVCGILLLLAVGVIVIIKTFDANSLRVPLMTYVRDSFGVELSVGDIALQFSPAAGLSLRVDDVALMKKGEDRANAPIVIEQITAGVDIVHLVTQRKIIVTKVRVDSPAIRVVLRKDGSINVQDLFVPVAKPARAIESALQKNAAVSPGAVGVAAPFVLADDVGAMVVRSISIEGGTLHFLDEQFDEPLTVTLAQLSLSVSDFMFNKKTPFALSFSMWSAPVTTITGSFLVDRAIRFRLDDVRTSFDLSKYSFEKMQKDIPPLRQLPITPPLEGRLSFVLHQMVVDPAGGLPAFSAQGELIDGKIITPAVPFAIENIDARFTLTENMLTVSDLFLYVASGTFRGKGRIDEYLNARHCSFSFSAEQLAVEEMIPADLVPLRFTGKLFASGEGRISFENPEPTALLSSLAVDGSLSVVEGQIHDFNVLRFIFDKITIIPGLFDQLMTQLPETYQKKLALNDTTLSKVSTEYHVSDQRVTLSQTQVCTEEFSFLPVVHYDLLRDVLSVSGALFLSADLSADIVKGVEELAGLQDETGAIKIPLQDYQGPARSCITYPDVIEIGKKIARVKGKDELRKVIFKALDLDGETDTEVPSEGDMHSPAASETQSPENPEPEKELINTILNVIFK